MEGLDPEPMEDIDDRLRTRSGYPVVEAVRSFKVALEQSGPVAAGKSLHYTADLICSGCFELWQRMLYEYALDHIGIGSPRIFWFLQQRFKDLNIAWAKIPAEQFYKTLDYQKNIAECVLILRSCPRRPPLKMPKVPYESHNAEWVRGLQSTPSIAVGRVFRHGQDLPILRKVGDEFAKACADGQTEKALFWLKWLYEEESNLRKQDKSLSSLERGPSSLSQKQRTHVGFFLANLLLEIYKDLAPKTGLRMNEEFQAILQLFAYPNKQLTQKRRTDLLCLAIQIVCEVPRWKVPAAPSLVQDPVVLERAVSHAEGFFREVLLYDPPVGDIVKEAKKGKSAAANNQNPKVLTKKQMKELETQQHIDQYNAIMDRVMFGVK